CDNEDIFQQDCNNPCSIVSEELIADEENDEDDDDEEENVEYIEHDFDQIAFQNYYNSQDNKRDKELEKLNNDQYHELPEDSGGVDLGSQPSYDENDDEEEDQIEFNGEITSKSICDNNQPSIQRTCADVYDFNSDEESNPHPVPLHDKNHSMMKLITPKASTQQLSNELSSTTSSSVPQESSSQAFQNPQKVLDPLHTATTSIPLQPFINQPRGLPIVKACHPQQQTLAPFFPHPIGASFILPANTSTPISFSQNPSDASVIFNTNAFAANGQFKLVSLPIPQHQTKNSEPSNLQSTAKLVIAQSNGVLQNDSANNIAKSSQSSTKPNRKRKNTKKMQQLTNNNSNDVNLSVDNHVNGETLILAPQEYRPMKGKGKGNRKPRISFVSVINGITVGADGIRRKFHCSHCGNGNFKTKSHLQRHMLTHTGEKPYHCQECDAKFNQSSSLRNHIIAIHTKKFPHICTICGKGFLMPAVLQKHMQTTGHQSEISLPPLLPSNDDSANVLSTSI
ncbi:zinc finger domain-containing protein 19, partial [Sarcoptes scabiei]